MSNPNEYTPINESSISETLDIVHTGLERLNKNDVYKKHRKAAEWGLANGLISYKSDSEINYEMRSKPWLTVNHDIKRNEKLSNVDDDYDTCINPS